MSFEGEVLRRNSKLRLILITLLPKADLDSEVVNYYYFDILTSEGDFIKFRGSKDQFTGMKKGTMVVKKPGERYFEVVKDGYYKTANVVTDPESIIKTNNFLNGFDSKYPKPDTKLPIVNSQTVGYGTKEILKILGN